MSPTKQNTPSASKKKAGKPSSPKEASSDTKSSASIGGRAVSERGRTFTGVVISDRMHKTVTVEWPRRKYVQKYQRYEKRRTRVKAHDEMGCKVGDHVEIRETRPLSKTKNFIVIRKISE